MPDTAAPPEILLMGAGNTIMADEGIGPVCLERLASGFDFPPEVGLEDVGTMGLSMLSLLPGVRHVIIIDAAQDTGHEPGTVVLFTPEDLVAAQVMHSAHDPRLTDVLRAAALSGYEPESVRIVGVQIARLEEWVLELSPAVEAAVPVACAAALDQLRRLGVEATPKPGADVAAITEALEAYALEG